MKRSKYLIQSVLYCLLSFLLSVHLLELHDRLVPPSSKIIAFIFALIIIQAIVMPVYTVVSTAVISFKSLPRNDFNEAKDFLSIFELMFVVGVLLLIGFSGFKINNPSSLKHYGVLKNQQRINNIEVERVKVLHEAEYYNKKVKSLINQQYLLENIYIN